MSFVVRGGQPGAAVSGVRKNKLDVLMKVPTL